MPSSTIRAHLLRHLELAAPREARIAAPVNQSGDVETGVNGRFRSQAEMAQLRARPLAAHADREVGPPPPRRASPVLANARRLVNETAHIFTADVAPVPPNLIATTYGARPDKQPYENVADNLLLDINLCFEEELQKALEHDKHFIESARQIVAIIHTKLGFASHGALEPGETLGVAAKEERERFILQKLEVCYPPEAISAFLRNGQRWSEEVSREFLDNRRTGVELSEAQIHEAEGLLKVLNMLQTQVPYFGGSVEYEKHIDDSLEFWVYHLSTLTRDPSRRYLPSELGLGQLIKPLKDYRTNDGGDVPFMNQRNLGTGVAEAAWSQLPPMLRDAIEARLKTFSKHIAQHGDQLNPGSATTLWRAYKKAGENTLHPGAARDRTFNAIESEKLWNRCNEDDRKAIYSDVCRVPWSDAHLIGGGDGFEQRYRSESEGSPRVKARHPPREKVGLMNVAGVFGNILETPLTAGGKYMASGGQKLETLLAKEDLKGGPQNKTLLQDFVGKHKRWHKSALTNHKPIIGGISGHTLGYMNLYAEALSHLTPEEQRNAPQLETLRGIMLAGLVGNKRHHSVDEVFSASTSVDSPMGTPAYGNRASYADLFNSTDVHIQLCAQRALGATETRYTAYETKTVLTQIPTRNEQARNGLRSSVNLYIAELQSPQIRGRVNATEIGLVEAVRQCMGAPGSLAASEPNI